MNNTDTYRIAIIGYGRMGHEIEKIAQERSHEIVFTVDPYNSEARFKNLEEAQDMLAHTDAIIDFSFPDAIVENSKVYIEHKIPTVIGTTGWSAHYEEIRAKVETHNATILHGGNFSIGAHLIIKMNAYAARLISKIEDYDIGVYESHHAMKKDRPSGTAMMIANSILDNLPRKTRISKDLPQDREVSPEELYVVSHRIGSEMGFHETCIDSPFDTIKISHHARSRAGFALGAVLGVEWLLHTKIKGCIHVDNFIQSLIEA